MGTTQKEEKVREQPGKSGQGKENQQKDRPYTERRQGEDERPERRSDR